MSGTNVLVTSIGNKVPALKAIRNAMIRALPEKSILYGADCKANCVGKYFVDHYWQMPLLKELSLNDLMRYCKENDIGFIIPTRDGELPFFAEHKNELGEYGIKTMVPELRTVQTCLDKLEFYNVLLQTGFPVIETIKNIENSHFDRYVVKENFGAGSLNIGLNLGKEEALAHAQKLQSPVFQPFIQGKEYSIDLYADGKGCVKGTVARRRDYIVNGEAQITTSQKFPELEELCIDVAKTLNITGHAVIQVIVDEKGDFHIVECNCRFGGASTLSIAMGLDSFYWFFMEALGIEREQIIFRRSACEKTQIRYAEDWII